MRRAVLVLILGLVAGGCDPVTEPSELIAGTWRLATLQSGSQTRTPPDPDRYTITFGVEDRISVRADCNSCGGTFHLAGDRLTVSALACTLVACAPGSLDQPFLAVLTDDSTLEVDGGRLVLSSAEGRLELTR